MKTQIKTDRFICSILAAFSLALAALPICAKADPLSDALNSGNIVWSATNGDTAWFVETTNTFDGVSAAQSGIVTNFQSSVLTATLTGPGTLTFYWASQDAGGGFDYEFDIDGGYENDIVGNTAWTQDGPYTISAGPHTLTWTVSAYGDNDQTEAGFLDMVSYVVPIASPVTLTNSSYDGTNLNFTFTAQTGYTNSVQYSTNLNSTNWQVYTNISGGTGSTTVKVPLTLFGTSKTGFVRVHP